ncbi:MAG TPA: PIN domain-containing protein [Polyangiaceae bacterium]
MKVLLDTDVCIAILNRDERVRPHLERHASTLLRMSAITLAELRFGVAKSQQQKRAASNLRVLLSRVAAVPFDDTATERYGDLRTLLERRGAPIGPLDTLIAAHALALGWALATHNTREFRRVPGLTVEDWVAANS